MVPAGEVLPHGVDFSLTTVDRVVMVVGVVAILAALAAGVLIAVLVVDALTAAGAPTR